MDLTDENIRAFADIWKEEFGEVLTSDRAEREAGKLLELYSALVAPLPHDETGRTGPTQGTL